MKQQKNGGWAAVWSTLYLVGAVCLLLAVCGHCYPHLGQTVRETIAGATDGPAREAFGVFAEGLMEEEPVREVLARSYEVLTGDAS